MSGVRSGDIMGKYCDGAYWNANGCSLNGTDIEKESGQSIDRRAVRAVRGV